MLKIQGKTKAQELKSTTLYEQGITEDQFRSVLIQNPREIVGEALLVIGREVQIPGLQDAVDVLAIDRQGNLVILELKRGDLSEDADFQAIRYASYVSRWGYDEVRDQFQSFIATPVGRELYDEEDVTFTEILEEFCEEDYDLNRNQRIYLIGEGVREKVGSAAIWLRGKEVDLRVVNVRLFRDEDVLYLTAKTVIPTSTLEELQPPVVPKEPWKLNPKEWHLKERCSPETAELVKFLVEHLEEEDMFDEISWSQKFYIAGRLNGTNRFRIITRKSLIWISIYEALNFEEINRNEEIRQRIATRVGLQAKDIELQEDRSAFLMRCVSNSGLDREELIKLVEFHRVVPLTFSSGRTPCLWSLE